MEDKLSEQATSYEQIVKNKEEEKFMLNLRLS